MSESKEAMRGSEVDTTRATARLPGLNIEIVHHRAPGGEAEHISINLQAMPSFEAFGRSLEAVNPLLFWAEAAKLAWWPWLTAAHSAMLPLSPARPSSKTVPHRPDEPDASG